MRITELPMIREVREEYIDLCYGGNTRSEAIQELVQKYINEITIGAEDDGVLFWIGLADGQYALKELTTEVAQYGLASLDRLLRIDDAGEVIAPGDIKRRQERYALAPMPEKKIRKPRKKFRCQWQVGDTFAYQLKGQEAEKWGIAGKYMLLRKVDAYEFGDGILFPAVTLSMWEKPPFPQNTAEFLSVPMLKIYPGGRCGSPKWKHEYRTELIIKNEKQLEALNLEYLGNFQGVTMPDDEIVLTHPGEAMMTLLEMIDKKFCIYWKEHLIATGKLNLKW